MGVGVEEVVVEFDVAAAVPLKVDVAAAVPLLFVSSGGGAVSAALAEDSAAGGAVPDALAEDSAADTDETASSTAGSPAGSVSDIKVSLSRREVEQQRYESLRGDLLTFLSGPERVGDNGAHQSHDQEEDGAR